MTTPHDIPQTQAVNNAVLAGSPVTQHRFLIPSPIPTRRSRTYSASERAKCGPTLRGSVKAFCREKGHGFIQPEDGTNPLFVHISDIDGEYVPKEDDEVTYKSIRIPPRNEKQQAVHVQIIHLAPGVSHERWDTPPVGCSPSSSPSHGSIKDLHLPH